MNKLFSKTLVYSVPLTKRHIPSIQPTLRKLTTVAFDTESKKSGNPSFTLELLEKITEDDNGLPPPLLTRKCCDYYKQMNKSEKIEFFTILSKEFDVDRANAVKEAKEYINLGNNKIQAEKRLLRYLEPKYNLFFDRVHQLPGGLKFLVDMRSDLLVCIYPLCSEIMGSRDSPVYKDYVHFEENIKSKLKKYVLGFLNMKRITWEESSAELIEKISSYEAVHAVQDWKDIKRRLGPDRRVYAFFERNALNEPLVFVHVALVPEISNSIQSLLNAPFPEPQAIDQSTCAICYSITTQPGLGGINLGNYLIKRVVKELSQQFPNIQTFATLSPIPGFRKWLNIHREDVSIQSEFKDIKDWKTKLNRFNSQDQIELEGPLMRLCSRYILSEKRSGNNALDPVANFHLRNGACAHQMHWKADTSDKGLQESFGIMVNYNYISDRVESNHRLYQKNGTISISEPNLNGWFRDWIKRKK